MPDEFQLRRYYELGGRMITLGSDAHTSSAVGNGIEEGIRLAYKCGFRSYTIFEKRKPISIPIDIN